MTIVANITDAPGSAVASVPVPALIPAGGPA